MIFCQLYVCVHTCVVRYVLNTNGGVPTCTVTDMGKCKNYKLSIFILLGKPQAQLQQTNFCESLQVCAAVR